MATQAGGGDEWPLATAAALACTALALAAGWLLWQQRGAGARAAEAAARSARNAARIRAATAMRAGARRWRHEAAAARGRGDFGPAVAHLLRAWPSPEVVEGLTAAASGGGGEVAELREELLRELAETRDAGSNR